MVFLAIPKESFDLVTKPITTVNFTNFPFSSFWTLNLYYLWEFRAFFTRVINLWVHDSYLSVLLYNSVYRLALKIAFERTFLFILIHNLDTIKMGMFTRYSVKHSSIYYKLDVDILLLAKRLWHIWQFAYFRKT